MNFDAYELAAWLLSALAAAGAVFYRVAVKKRRRSEASNPEPPARSPFEAEHARTDKTIDEMDKRANRPVDDGERVRGSDPATVARIREWSTGDD